MNITLFLSVLLVLQLFCLYIGKKAADKIHNQQDYFLAGKSVSFFPLMMTFVATQIGGGIILGSSEEAYRYGWIVLLYPIGQCLGFVLLASGIGKRMAQFQVSTVAQLFEVVYKSVTLKKMASILSILSLFMILVAQIVASKKFMISLGVESDIIFAGFWGIVILYTVVGGLGAVIATDVVQAIYFMVIFIACFAFAYFVNSLSMGEVFKAGMAMENVNWSHAKFTGWLLMPLLFVVIEQDMAQRCFAAKSGKVVSWAAAGSALCILSVCMIPVFFGVLAKVWGVAVLPGASVFMTVIEASTNPMIAALVGCAIFVAIISTADSLINAIGSNVTQDFSFSSIKKKVLFSRFVTFIIAVAAIFISYFFNSIVDVLIQSYELSLSCLFVPVLVALFKRDGKPLSALLAMVFGAVSFLGFRFLDLPELPKEIISIAISLAGFMIGEMVSSTRGHVKTVD